MAPARGRYKLKLLHQAWGHVLVRKLRDALIIRIRRQGIPIDKHTMTFAPAVLHDWVSANLVPWWQDWYLLVIVLGCWKGIQLLRKNGLMPGWGEYFSAHAEGQLSLGSTYWISNLVVVAAVSLFAAGMLTVQWLDGLAHTASQPWKFAVGIAMFVLMPGMGGWAMCVLVLLCWQGIGIWKCTARVAGNYPLCSGLARLHALAVFGFLAFCFVSAA